MMANGWQIVPFSDVLKIVSRPETLDRDKTYRILGMRLYARGLFIREDKPGHKIQANELFRVRLGDFVYNRLFAWKGSFGIVDETTADGYVSGEFPCFQVITEKADPKFIQLFLSQEPVWNEIARISSGQTNISRLRLKVPNFLAMEIPLPPLMEQRRIVARIEALASRVAKAQSLRREASEEAELLLYSAMRQIFKPDGAKIVHLEKTCAAIIDNLHSNPDYSGDCTVPCIRSSDVGWGQLFLETARKTSEKEYTHRTIRGEPTENDIVLVREGGGTGKAALVERHHRFSLGQRVMMLRPDLTIVVPKFLLYQILSSFIYDEQILPLSKGSASPHLNIGSLRKFNFMLPPLEEQRRLVVYLDGLQSQVSALRVAQAETEKELSALMPSILDKAFKGEL
ncbi:MAG TPA: restriction endonuclease subunit S [Anaerolineales bacterium]|jgi:type I restriction enzyme S subunit